MKIKPLKFTVKINDELYITMPQILADSCEVKAGDSVYINLESIQKDTDSVERELIKPPKEKEIIPLTSSDTTKAKFEYTIVTNSLYKKAYEKLMELTKDNSVYPKEPQKSMRGFYTVRGGLCWLEYKFPGPRPFLVHLAKGDKGDYTEVDHLRKVAYSLPTKKTLGDYPTFKVVTESDIDYLVKLVKFAIDNNF